MKTINQKSQKNSLCLREPQTPIREPQTPNDLTTLQNSPSARWRGGWGVRLLLALVLHGTCSAQWTQIFPPVQSTGNYTFYDMSVLAGANGNDTIFVCGKLNGSSAPLLLKSFNGGQTWSNTGFTAYNPDGLSELQSVVVFRSGVVLCSGGNINGHWVYRSTDWGQTWNHNQRKVDAYVNGKWGPDDAYTHGGTLFNQWGFSKDEGLTYTYYYNTLGQWAGKAPYVSDSIYYVKKDDGCVYKTVNQGQTWQGCTCNGTGGVSISYGHFFNSDTGIWCGGNQIIKTYNGGQNWSFIPLPIQNGTQVTAYFNHFHDNNLGVAWGSYVSFTEDAGNTWQTDTSSQFGVGSAIFIGTRQSIHRTAFSCYVLGTQALVKRSMLTNTEAKMDISIQVFPNPSGNELNFKGFQGDEQVEVYNLMGIKMKSCIISEKIQLQVTDGQYLIKIISKNSGQSFTKNIIVKNP